LPREQVAIDVLIAFFEENGSRRPASAEAKFSFAQAGCHAG
jgi:hypothetical protein